MNWMDEELLAAVQGWAAVPDHERPLIDAPYFESRRAE